MKTLSLDIETFSDVNLNKTGVYAYACSPNFEILLLSYSVDGGKVEVVDLARGEKLPEEIAEAIKSRASLSGLLMHSSKGSACLNISCSGCSLKAGGAP
jgi:DNA polymerase